jgi:putative ATPase
MPQPSLFDALKSQTQAVPLAERMRPQTLADVVGQSRLLQAGQPFARLFQQAVLPSLLFWGPPGSGKTTLASLLAHQHQRQFVTLNAVQAGVKEVRQAVSDAEDALKMGQRTVLFIDEIHRFSKTQQDALLPWVEKGTFTLIGATTENPAFQVIPPLLSRVLLVRLEALTTDDMASLLQRAQTQVYPQQPLSPDVLTFLCRYGNGDARAALTLLEAVMACLPEGTPLTPEWIEALVPHYRASLSEDDHFDLASAYQKSLRGSDADAAIYWLAKFIANGEDPRFIARRLVVTAAEDVGLADPQALVIAEQAAQALERLGLPEGRIPLAMATIYVARAPKSNAAIVAIDAALAAIQQHGHNYPVPTHLRDAHYAAAKPLLGHGQGYVYTHTNPTAAQTFLPDALVDGHLEGHRFIPEPTEQP